MNDFASQIKVSVGDEVITPAETSTPTQVETSAPAPVSKPAILENSDGSKTIVDAKGRSIRVKRLTALQRMRLFKIVGPDGSENPAYFGFAALAACVTQIGDEPINQPTSLLQIEALVQRLEDHGLAAVATVIANEQEGVAAAAQNLSSAAT